MPSTEWHEPQEWLEGEKLTAAELIEQLKDNLTYLYEKNFDVVQVSGVSDYQTTSTSVVAVATTLYLGIQKHTQDTLVKLSLNASIYSNTASGFIYFDVLIDNSFYASSGTGTPAAAGLVRYQQDTANIVSQLSLEAFIEALDVGSHSFQLVWWVGSGTGTMNVTNTIAQFAAEEYGVANVNIV